MIFYIGFANETFRIEPHYEQLYDYCRGFYRAPADNAYDASVSLADIEAEANEGDAGKLSYPMLEGLAVYRKISEYLPQKNSFLFHSSALSLDGEAYIFAAASGTGKSTHARLWREYFKDRVTMINDDKPVITCSGGKAYVSGTPWNGKHRLSTDITVPVKAICFLQRGKENKIEKEDEKAVFEKLWAQSYKPRSTKSLANTLNIISDLIKSTEFYKLECNMAPEAALISYNGMKG